MKPQISNPFFSQIMRIQAERGHIVATGGPYRYVRHPAYAGAILYEMTVSVLLASWWALLASGLSAILLVIRTIKEQQMVKSFDTIEVYIEAGKKRVFAGAIDWPGWCRSGRDEGAALKALLEYGPRYAHALRRTDLGFRAPQDASALTIVERLEGTGTTDFGAPDNPPSSDDRPLSEADMKWFRELLQACWAAFDDSVKAASGIELRKGARGGGRNLDKIVQHVQGADTAYLSKLGWKVHLKEADGSGEALRLIRQGILDGLEAAAAGQIPERGARGGLHWKPRYFVRRSVWHLLDHAWEIEDRSR